MPNDPHSQAGDVRRLDLVALGRWERRMALQTKASWLHDEVGRRMAERIGLIKQAPDIVLDWSLDAGPPMTSLRLACPKARIYQVSEGLVGSESKAPEAGSWRRWLQLLASSGQRSLAVDSIRPAHAAMVWSNMSLHREADPLNRLKAWRSALRPDGFVMFSGLGPGSLKSLRDIYAQRGWGAAMAPLVDMHDWGDMLVEAGFADPVMDQETLCLTYSSPDALITELRTLGSNAAQDRYQGLRTRRWLKDLKSSLQELTDSKGRVALQFELVYGHAFRTADRGPAVAETTRIGLDDMKLMLRNRSPSNGVG